MSTGLLSPVLVLLLVAVLSVHSSYIFRGNGTCATSNISLPENMFEYTQLTQPTSMWESFSHTNCSAYCDTQTEPECIGYAYYASTGNNWFHWITVHQTCHLYGLDGQGNFTATFSPTQFTTIEYNDTGSANTRTFYDGSGIGTGYTCYEKVSGASAIGDPHITSIYGCKVDAPVNESRDEEKVVLMDCEYERLEIRYRKSWNEHITRVDI